MILLSEFIEKDEVASFKEKRNQIYSELSTVLENKGIAVLSCRTAAVKIEKNIRKLDPEFGDVYYIRYKEIINEIQAADKLTLEDIIEKYYDTPTS